MKIGTTFEQLFHIALDLGLGEVDTGVFQQTRQIVVHVWRYHEHAGLLAHALGSLDGHFFEFQDVDMVKLFQQFDLSERGYGKPVFFVVHQDLLQSNNLSRLFGTCFGDFSECAFTEFSQIVIFSDSGAAMEPRSPVWQPFEGFPRTRCRRRHCAGDSGSAQVVLTAERVQPSTEDVGRPVTSVSPCDHADLSRPDASMAEARLEVEVKMLPGRPRPARKVSSRHLVPCRVAVFPCRGSGREMRKTGREMRYLWIAPERFLWYGGSVRAMRGGRKRQAFGFF